MELLKQKLKTKKYQYLYLIEKLWHQSRKAMFYEEIGFCDAETEERTTRIWKKNLDWLSKLNRKYNYYTGETIG